MVKWPSISEIVASVAGGQTKALSLVDKSLNLIDQKSEYNAVISIVTERARSRAQEIDDMVANGQPVGRLAGVPFIAKDNFLTFGSETTAASNMLRGFIAPYQSTAIELLESEGAICVAKANLDAFAHGSSTENSDFMITKNPHDKAKVPGGSSGGSAASVVLDMVPFALGTDTGGSIRLPAAFCGAVGYKPTYGLVSRSGVVAMASSTDVVGPLAKTVEDVAYVLDIIAGQDKLDSTSVERFSTSYLPEKNYSLGGKKVGVVKEFMDDSVDKNVKEKIDATLEILEKQGASIKEVSLPSLPLSLASYYVIMPAEVSSNLSRYDGQRFGYTDQEAKDLESSYVNSRTQGFGKEAKLRIMIGTYVLSSGYYDAYYNKAQQLRTKLIKEFDATFEEMDFIVGPTAPSTAFDIGANINDPIQMYLSDIMTVAASLVGIPAISIPVGMVKGLPVGFQIMTRQHRDKDLLSIAKKTEELMK